MSSWGFDSSLDVGMVLTTTLQVAAGHEPGQLRNFIGPYVCFWTELGQIPYNQRERYRLLPVFESHLTDRVRGSQGWDSTSVEAISLF